MQSFQKPQQEQAQHQRELLQLYLQTDPNHGINPTKPTPHHHQDIKASTYKSTLHATNQSQQILL
jgi:hypothetical protein